MFITTNIDGKIWISSEKPVLINHKQGCEAHYEYGLALTKTQITKEQSIDLIGIVPVFKSNFINSKEVF